MAAGKSPIALSNFFSNLFHNFPKLILTNLLFAVPLTVILGALYLLSVLFHWNMVFVMIFALIPLFPFYAGIVQVTSHMVREEESVSVFENFLSGVRNNWIRFLIHGIILSAATFLSYISFTFNFSENPLFDSEFLMAFRILSIIVTVLISIFFLFAFFYIPSMTVTFDIRMKYIYKNSALMTFGELKHNLFAVFGLLILGLVCLTVLLSCIIPVAIIIATIVLAAVFVPSIVSFIINSAVYKRMYVMMVDRDKVTDDIERKMEEKREKRVSNQTETDTDTLDMQSIITFKIDKDADPEEYIYFNGKMIKRGVLLKMKEDAVKKGTETQ